MILVDTIVKMDTVYVEKVNELVSQKDILNQVGTMHTMYSDNFSNLVILFGLAITIVGIIIPYIIHWHNRKQLEKDLKEEFEKKYNKKIEEKTQQLKDEIEKEIKKFDYYHQGYNVFSLSLNYKEKGNHIKSYKCLLQSFYYFIRTERLSPIEKSLDSIKAYILKLESNSKDEFEFPYNLDKVKFLKRIRQLTKGKKNLETITNQFTKVYCEFHNISFDEIKEEPKGNNQTKNPQLNEKN